MARDKKKELRSAVAFSKAQLLRFERYAGRRDLLRAILREGEYYTIAQVDDLIAQFMKGVK